MAYLSTLTNVKEYLGVTSTTDDTLLTNCLDRASAAIDRICRRTLLSTSHREIRSGDGAPILALYNYPVTAVEYLAIGKVAPLYVSNSNANGAYMATVSVSDTSMSLVISGGTDAGTDTLTLSTYTLTTLVAAINALGKGWAATLTDTNYGDWSASELIPVYGQNCYDGLAAYIYCPGTPESEFVIDLQSGLIESSTGFVFGTDNVIAKYTAGYSTVPVDLEQVAIEAASLLYKTRKQDKTVHSERLADHQIAYAVTRGGLTDDMIARLTPYVNWGF